MVPGGDAHAGRTETSILLALDPSVVRLAAAEVGNTAPLQDADARADAAVGCGRRPPNGVLGDPRGATAAEGEALLATLVENLRDELGRWKPDERGPPAMS